MCSLLSSSDEDDDGDARPKYRIWFRDDYDGMDSPADIYGIFIHNWSIRVATHPSMVREDRGRWKATGGPIIHERYVVDIKPINRDTEHE